MLLVDIAAMADIEDSDILYAIIDRIDNAIITYPNTIKFGIAQFLASERTGVRFEREEFWKNPILKGVGKFLKLPLSACGYLDGVR